MPDESAPVGPELQNLLDRQAILDCLNRYNRGVDRCDEELLLSAYHEDATECHGTFTGPRGVRTVDSAGAGELGRLPAPHHESPGRDRRRRRQRRDVLPRAVPAPRRGYDGSRRRPLPRPSRAPGRRVAHRAPRGRYRRRRGCHGATGAESHSAAAPGQLRPLIPATTTSSPSRGSPRLVRDSPLCIRWPRPPADKRVHRELSDSV